MSSLAREADCMPAAAMTTERTAVAPAGRWTAAQTDRTLSAALQIRVFGYSRATNGFDSRKHCDKRRYEYILPEWAFDSRRGQGRAAAVRAASAAAATKDAAAAVVEDGAGAAGEGGAGQQQPQEEERQAGAAAAATEQAETGAAGDAGADAAAVERAEQAPAAAPEDGAAADAAAGMARGGEPRSAPDDGAGAMDGEPAAPAGTAAAPGAAGDGAFMFDDACTQRLTQILSIVSPTPRCACCSALGACVHGQACQAARLSPHCAAHLRARQHCSDARAGPRLAGGCSALHSRSLPACLQIADLLRVFLPCPGSQYEGTHNFHNFTVRKPASAPDVKRYILSFRCVWLGVAHAEVAAGCCHALHMHEGWPRPGACVSMHAGPACCPASPACSCRGVFEINGERWVKMVVVGQSFMLHQIRKMASRSGAGGGGGGGGRSPEGGAATFCRPKLYAALLTF